MAAMDSCSLLQVLLVHVLGRSDKIDKAKKTAPRANTHLQRQVSPIKACQTAHGSQSGRLARPSGPEGRLYSKKHSPWRNEWVQMDEKQFGSLLKLSTRTRYLVPWATCRLTVQWVHCLIQIWHEKRVSIDRAFQSQWLFGTIPSQRG